MKVKANIFYFFAIITCFFCCHPSRIEAAIYYVDQSHPLASDSNVGSEDYPWLTVQKGMAVAVAGDTVRIKHGTYVGTGSGNRVTPAFRPSNSGNQGNPIIFEAYPSEAVVNLTISSGVGGPVIGSYQKNYIQFKGFTVMEGETALQDTGAMIYWSATNGLIENCEIVGRDRSFNDNHSGIRIEGVNTLTVKNCLIHGFSSTANKGWNNHSGIEIYTSSYIDIENNEFYGSNTQLFMKIYGQNCNFRYNFFHDSYGVGIFMSSGNNLPNSTGINVYQNLFLNTGSYSGSIILDQYLGDVNVYNNTFYNCTADISQDFYGGFVGGRSYYSGYTWKMWNNLVAKTRNPITWRYGAALNISYLDYNWHYNNSGTYNVPSDDRSWHKIAPTNGSFTNWKTYYPNWDQHSGTTDPLFVNAGGTTPSDYKLLSNSPCLTGGRGGSYSFVVGAYITGDEIIGRIKTTPSAPTDLRVVN